MKVLLFISTLLLFYPTIFAQDKISDSELEEMIQDDPTQLGQIRDIESGIMVDRHRIKDDQNRISFLYHANPNLYDITKISALEFNYAYHFRNYWMEFFYIRTQAEFGRIADTNINDIAESDKLEESNDDLNIFGIGISMRGAWIQELVNSESVYTHTGANLGYYSLNQNLVNQNYTGPGLKADFGIHVRSSKTMHYGLRTSYHLAHVKRPQAYEGERSQDRSLLLTWMTIGVDLSFYF